jgi:putative FmdB family regulatory protein
LKEVFVLPLYEYECLSCGERFEALQKFSDSPLTECKFCKGSVKRLLGTPALQFKGTGWYITDYAGKSPKPEKAGKGSGEAAAGNTGAGSSCGGACCPTKAGGDGS